MVGMTEPTHMTADEFLKGLAELGWRQVEFAARAGVTKDTVNRWAHGRLAVPPWAAAHLRLLIAAKQFHAAHVAPLPRSRKPATDTIAEGEDAWPRH
jgi:DNA-binding transcriptional regulator YiaG